MNDSDFNAMMDKLYELTPAQWETLFAKTWEHFRYNNVPGVERDAVAWRAKQAMMILRHRKKT